MGFSSPETKRYGLQLSNDIILYNDTTAVKPDDDVEYTVKKIELGLDIFTLSNIKLSYEHRVTNTGSGELITTKVYLNDVLIDTETHNDVAWELVTLDITGHNWTKGDEIKITITVKNVAGAYNGELKELRLYALNTPFYNTQES